MKILLVMDSAEQQNRISEYVKALGFDSIWYRFVLKAMDNIDEINPDGIFVSAVDFPRHWKALVSFFRSTHPASVSPVVVLVNNKFTEKESEKAKHLDVNCLLPEYGADAAALDCLRRVLQSTVPAEKWLDGTASTKATQRQLAMIITNPLTGALIPGKIKKITNFGAVFASDFPELSKNIEPETILKGCSLRAGGAILSPVCKVINNGDTLSLEFLELCESEKKSLEKFLASIS
ncbi:MAG: hypothetical protein Ta2F_13310 [Termitinemataceae bacterium]|nr:MAG: hypothetical protein Ta2F_13310 [Termitinemataceae bacterium]